MLKTTFNLMTPVLVAACLLMTGQTASHASITAQWNFNEGAGSTTAEQISATASDAFPAGVTWSTDTAGPGSSASLDFNNARFGANLNANDVGIAGTGAKTIGGWIQTTQTGKRYFWGWSPENGLVPGADLRWAIEDNGKLRFEVSGGFTRLEGGPAVNDGQWHFVAAVIPDSATLDQVQFYVNGSMYNPTSNTTVAINTAGSGVGGINTPNEFFFGSGGNTTSDLWIGKIDRFFIADSALTLAELDAIRNQTLIPEPASLALLGLGGLLMLRRRRTRE